MEVPEGGERPNWELYVPDRSHLTICIAGFHIKIINIWVDINNTFGQTGKYVIYDSGKTSAHIISHGAHDGFTMETKLAVKSSSTNPRKKDIVVINLLVTNQS